MGTLPSSIGSTRPNNWRFFSVYDNHLEGPLHMETMKLKKAYMLDFSHNKFYGTISNEINTPNFSTLRMIYLNNNLLTGTIPDNLMQMRKMKALFLNDNREFPKTVCLYCLSGFCISPLTLAILCLLFKYSPHWHDSVQH